MEGKSSLQVRPLIQLLLFFLNPFISFCFSLYSIKRSRVYSIRDYQFLFLMISLFMGALAFTQKTNHGDIIRTYEGIVNDSYAIQRIVLEFGSSLFRLINVNIYRITGNVQYVSFFWVTLIYFLSLSSIVNIFKFKGVSLSNRVFIYVIAILFCFIIYTQVTEIMKQGVATSLFLFGFTNLVNKRWVVGILPILFSLGIHGSSFFFLPLFITLFVNGKKTFFVLALISFLFREFNLMTFVSGTFSDFSLLSPLATLAEGYSRQNMTHFFRSDSLYFTTVFFVFLGYVLYVYTKQKNNSVFLNVCLLMIFILNLNYGVSHNFTRMLTMLFPFYIMLYSELDEGRDVITDIVKKILLFSSSVFSFALMYGRLSPTGGYLTSYMDNSILQIIISPLHSYLTTSVF